MNTLASLSERLEAGATPSIELGNWLDDFYREPRVDRLADEPRRLASLIPLGETWDAFLAATAEHLCRQYHLSPPAWAFDACRQLHRPAFGSPSAALRATLLIESPPAFRSRNIFVTSNALDRASRHASGTPQAAVCRGPVTRSTGGR